MHFIPFGEHSEQFGSRTKLGAKQVELVQKFVPQSRVRIFRNERTRASPLDPKLMFWGIPYYLGAFGLFGRLTKLGAKRAELAQKFVPRTHHWNFSKRTHPIHPVGS